MKIFFLFSLMSLVLTVSGQTLSNIDQNEFKFNRAPLRQNPYSELSLGAITPNGWLKEMLVRQKNGATGNLDNLYPSVMGSRNGWLGGDGDQWERGPYWIDGLLPLAYILKDEALKEKVQPWIEWAIKSQRSDGYFGPAKDYGAEEGLQRDNSKDWWPKMVMLKVLQQYYMGTQDKRIINLFSKYFKYQLKELPTKPLDHWSFWARYRGADNLQAVYWLYNITGEKFLLELADVIHSQTFDYTNGFLNTDLLSTQGSIHCVNLAQGIKSPMIYYQQHPEKKYVDATKKGFSDLRKFDEMAHGLFGGDEGLHGNNPTQGSELCSAVEMMYSLENILKISGDVNYADRLEKIAFNALPAQTSDDYMSRQYFQQANQVMLTRESRNFDVNHNGTDVVYGLLTGYPCCTSNMHQGWPKFTQNLWYASADKGIAALVYAPSEVTTTVADGKTIRIKEETNYPFEESIKFTLNTENKREISFPLHLRIPAWCDSASITVNGELIQQNKGNQIVKVNRVWKDGDVVKLNLPMHVFSNKWYENSVSIERGPITFALKIGEKTDTVANTKDPINYGKSYIKVLPTTPWNYGLLPTSKEKLKDQYEVRYTGVKSNFPWNLKNVPVEITTKARKIPNWQIYNGMTGPIPYSVIYNEGMEKQPIETITLVPYGSTQLRISQFPIVGR